MAYHLKDSWAKYTYCVPFLTPLSKRSFICIEYFSGTINSDIKLPLPWAEYQIE
jgi:hypothetical protein